MYQQSSSIFQGQSNNQAGSIFQNNQNTNNSMQSNNTSMNRSQSANPLPYKMGSYREEFSSQRLDQIRKEASEDYSYSDSLILQRPYEKMNNIMLRIEDYYLIRTNQIELTHQRYLDQAVKNSIFPQSLLQNNQSLKCPIFFPEKTRSQWTPGGNNNQLNNNGNNNNSSNNMVNYNSSNQTGYSGMGGGQSDIFKSNQQTNNYGNNSTSSLFTQNNNKPMFQQNQPTSIYGSQQNQTTGNNPFSGQSSNSNVFSQNQNNQQHSQSSMFSQPNGNLFSSNNLFAQQPNNNNLMNSQNLFSQGQMFNSMPMQNQNNLMQQYKGNPNFFNQSNMQMPYNPMMMNQWAAFNQQMMPNNPYYMQQRWDDQTLQTTIDFLQQELLKSQQVAERQQRQEEREYELIILNAQEQQQRLEDNERKIYRQATIQRTRTSRSPSPNVRLFDSKFVKRSSRSPSINRSVVFGGSMQHHMTHTIGQSRVNNNNINKSFQRITPSRVSEVPHRKDVVKFSVRVQVEFLESEKVFPNDLTVEVYAQNTIFETKSRILNQLKEKGAIMPHTSIDKYLVTSELYYGQTLCSNECLVKQIAEFSESSKFRFNIFQTVVPLLTKRGYQTKPSMQELARMPLDRLRCVQSFTIFNEHGGVTWVTPTDLTYINLDEVVELKEMEIEIYEEEVLGVFFKPEVHIVMLFKLKHGKKLNKTCVATFKLSQALLDKYAYPPGSEFEYNHEQIYDLLKCKAQEMQIKLIDFDAEQLQYQVQIEHFTKYSFTDSCKKQTNNFEEKEVDDYQQETEWQNQQYHPREEKYPANIEEHYEDGGGIEQEQDEELDDLKNLVQRNINYAASQRVTRQQQQTHQVIDVQQSSLIRLMKFNQRMFREYQGDAHIYATQYCGAHFNHQSSLVVHSNHQITIIKVHPQQDGPDRTVTQVVEAIMSAQETHLCAENLVFQFVVRLLNSQLLDVQNGQLSHEQFVQYKELGDLLNILFGNPTLNVKRYLSRIRSADFDAVFRGFDYDKPLLEATALDSLRRSCLKQWLMAHYWQHDAKKHQDSRGYYRYLLISKFLPCEAISVTSQVIPPEVLSQDFVFASTSDAWLSKLLKLLNSQQDMKSFWSVLRDSLQLHVCDSLVQTLITFRLFLNKPPQQTNIFGGAATTNQDQTLFLKCVAYLEKIDGSHRVILLYIMTLFGKLDGENTNMLKRVLKNTLSELVDQDTQNNTILQVVHCISKYLYREADRERFIQQCYTLFPSARVDKFIDERIIVRPKVYKMLHKFKLMKAVMLADKYNLSSLVVLIATAQLLPLLINQFTDKSDDLNKVVGLLKRNKKALPGLKKSEWWLQRGKLFVEAAQIVQHIGHDDMSLHAFQKKIMEYRAENVQQHKFKERLVEAVRIQREVAICE